MRILTICLLLAASSASIAVLLQSRTLSETRQQNATLRSESVAAQTESPQDAFDPQELARLREETRDLLKLRNAVRQLRSHASELSRARAENARLKQMALAAPSNPATNSPVSEGFVPRDALVESGLVTPESAVQTYFRAMRDGDVARFIQCMSPKFRQREKLNEMPPEKFTFYNEQLKEELTELMNRFTNFKIVERKDLSPDKVVLGVQSSVGPSVMRLTLVRVGNEWFIENPY